MVFPIGGGGFSNQSLFGIQKAKSLLSDTINRISSGNRIPFAAADPAGLTVSEKFRGQIRSFYKAQNNTQDGISLLRTAEGGLSTMSDDLNRLRELTIQAGNGAYTAEDIGALENEAKQILAGINDTSGRTQFNTRNLLDGSTSGSATSNASDVEAYLTGNATQSGSFEGRLSASTGDNGERVFELTLSGGGESRSVTLDSNNRARGALQGVDLQFEDIDSARVSGSEVNFEDTFTFSNAEATTITDAGGDAVTVNFAAGNITSSDMVDQLNTDFAANAVDVQASLDDDGNVVLNGANSGEDFTISGTSSGFSQATGLFDQNVNAAAGETASAEGLNNEQYVSEGISFDSTVSFTVQDGQSGAATQVDIGGAGTTSTRAELLDDINSQLEAGGQRVDARFTDAGELTFESRDVGNQSRVSVEDVSAGADTLRSTLAVSDRSDSGEGSTRFDLEVNSSDLSFQTGSNQGQSQAFSFGSFSSGALNLEDVDLQSQEGRDDFLGRVDGAIDRVSSARSSIGARENRFSSTFNRLSSSIRDSTATESSIRDSDLAIESIKLAQQQMKMKSALYAQTQMLDINKGFAAKIFG